MNEHHCPICHTPLPLNLRYPAYICPDCIEKATDIKGRPLEFFNTTMGGGGFSARYADTQEPYDSPICFIGPVVCRADEGRFGGIVVQKLG